MEFSIPESLAPTLVTLRRFIDEHVVPLEPQALQGFGAVEAELGALRDRAREAGLWLPQLSREHGGMGLSVLEHGMVSEV
ncbi:MAG: acyl-CoA dehydrogenase family protein, partial [Deltaproteobacteria bacterium]|nr:acyl-CoA dehydrogenase family protein [Deltaproteobacteria bacterium]